MELSEIQSACFSKWVGTDQGSALTRTPSERKVYVPNIKYSEEELKELLHQWSKSPGNSPSKKLKLFIRQGIEPKMRCCVWNDSCGGSASLASSPNFFHDVQEEIGILIPEHLPEGLFLGKGSPCYYFLNEEGKRTCREILYVLTQVNSDLHYCPLLPFLTAIFLHFMDENQCYSCMSAIISSNRALIDQSGRAVAVMAKTFQDCLKSYRRPSYKKLKSFLKLFDKRTVMFPNWVDWIFHSLDFWSLVFLVDSFLIQGPKILIRVGLVLFDHFAKYCESQNIALETSEDKNVEELFYQSIDSLPVHGFKLMQTAFKIRGLSRSRLRKFRSSNMLLLEMGQLSVPDYGTFVEPLTLFSIQGSDLLTAHQWEQLCSWLPKRLRIKRPVCIFSTEKDGYRVRSLYNKCETEEETLLLIRTSNREVIGAFLTAPWSERTAGEKSLTFFGTGESFVFSLAPKSVKYPWLGVSSKTDDVQIRDYFMAGDDKCLIIGGGGGNSLWLDEELNNGRSSSSQTFGNEPLVPSEDFTCSRVDVISFISET